MPKAKLTLPWGKVVIERPVNERLVTPLIYYGGKSRDSDWIISHFPPYGNVTYVEVFGGGGAVFLRKRPSRTDVYNDLGNVSTFMSVMRKHGGRLVNQLYQTPFGRDEFTECRRDWPGLLERYRREVQELGPDSEQTVNTAIEFARCWFVTINQGYTHEELCDSWRVAKQVDPAAGFRNHVDDIPWVMQRLRECVIENRDFSQLIPLYDLEDGSTLFYCDPPYVHDTRADVGNYICEMSLERHVELLGMLRNVKGQVVVSGYDHEVYNDMLSGWKKVTKTAKSSIQNSKSVLDRGDRTEVLWIKEHNRGLWAEYPEDSQADVARVSYPAPTTP